MMDDKTLFFRFLKEYKSYMSYKKKFSERANGKFDLVVPTHYVCSAFVWNTNYWISLHSKWIDFYHYFKSLEQDQRLDGSICTRVWNSIRKD